MDNEIDDIEELKRWISAVIQNAGQADAKRLKQAMDAMLTGASQVGDILQGRVTAFTKQRRSRRSKPQKSAPHSAPQKRSGGNSSSDTPKIQNNSHDRPKALSSIQQGIRQADPSLADQQRALRGKVYGAQNDDVAFNKAAKAITR